MGVLRDVLRPIYSIFRPIYVPLLRSAVSFPSETSSAKPSAFGVRSLPPFDTFLARARPQARVSKFHSRYPFALDRGPAAERLLTTDPNSPFGHEPELAHLLDMLVPDDGVFLDVGSNFGYFSIFVATRPNFRGRVHAFEPIAGSFAGLREIVDGLKCDAIVTCHQSAASDRIGVANMDISGDPGLASIKSGTIEHGETVKTVTLDSLNLDRVDFIKIDVEEHEASTLRGAASLIESNLPFIYLESWTFASQPDKVFEALQFLIDRGYKLYLPAWLQSNGTIFVGVGSIYEMEDFALFPFTLKDRLTFPGNPINIFACPKSREADLGALDSPAS